MKMANRDRERLPNRLNRLSDELKSVQGLNPCLMEVILRGYW